MRAGPRSVAVLCMTLTACATYMAVDPSKPVTIGNGVTVQSQVAWATFTSGQTGQIWTIDGVGLNELRFFTGITPGNPVMSISGVNRRDMIAYNATMLPNDVVDMISGTLSKAGYQQVRADGLRPAPFGSARGFRFELSLTTKDGLLVKGTALTSQREGKLDVILFLAPAEYYYDRHLPIVERIFSSVRVPDVLAAPKAPGA